MKLAKKELDEWIREIKERVDKNFLFTQRAMNSIKKKNKNINDSIVTQLVKEFKRMIEKIMIKEKVGRFRA